MRHLLLPLLFAFGLHAQDAAVIARMADADAVDAAALEQALQSSDALVRATAARVAMVRDVTSLVPALRARLGGETNAEAARELVRALVILGGDDDVAYAATQLARFPASIDAAFADALKRTGRPPNEKLRTIAVAHPVQRTPPQPVRGVAEPVAVPAFQLPLVLPRGLGAAILRDTGCRNGWIGVAEIGVDRLGRVQSIGTKGMQLDRACTSAFRTIARLALAQPPRLEAATTATMLMLRVYGAQPCFDEAAVTNTVLPPMPLRPGQSDVKAPKVLNRVEPYYPDSVRRQAHGVFSIVAEATITSEGCLRDIRLVQQTIYPELNRAAIEALSKWTFAPGTLNGVPVDVFFNLTVTFRH